ncbi:hypothetical protein TPA0909_41550 [Streptomyces albus]|nr:hypothetical protein TPA0909_41550 [Streptomyces albus]
MEGLWAPRRTAGRGRVIATTLSRERDLVTASGNPLLSVGVSTLEESLLHLRNALQRAMPAGADTELAGLADDLGHLPLALSRAAAYLDLDEHGLRALPARFRPVASGPRWLVPPSWPSPNGAEQGD